MAFVRGVGGRNIVVLMGSRHHVLGEQPSGANAELATSVLPSILMTIRKHVDLRETAAAEDWPYDYTSALEFFARYPRLEGSPQWMEFLAVPLVEGDVSLPGPFREGETSWDMERHHVVLGTPIYVAHAEPPDIDSNL